MWLSSDHHISTTNFAFHIIDFSLLAAKLRKSGDMVDLRKRKRMSAPADTRPAKKQATAARKSRGSKSRQTTKITSLPVELIEQICSWLIHPYHDAILSFRLANKTLAEKSSRFFAKAFFEHNTFTLASLRYGLRMLRQLQNSQFCEYIQNVVITPGEINIPCVPHGSNYQDFFKAKNLDPIGFANALSELPKLRVVCFVGFRSTCHSTTSTTLLRDVGPRFIQIMSEHLNVANLKTLIFERLEVRAHDVAALVSRHKKFLHAIYFDSVLLCDGRWTDVIRALRKPKDLSHVRITNPGERHGMRISDVWFTPDDYDLSDLHDTMSDMDSEDLDLLHVRMMELTESDEWADWDTMYVNWEPHYHSQHPRSWICEIRQEMHRFLDDMRDRYHRDYI